MAGVDTEKIRSYLQHRLEELERERQEVERKLHLVEEVEEMALGISEEAASEVTLEELIMEIFRKRPDAITPEEVEKELEVMNRDHAPEEVENMLNQLYHRGRIDAIQRESGRLFQRKPSPFPE